MRTTTEIIVTLNDLGISLEGTRNDDDANAQACFDAAEFLGRIEALRTFLAESPLPVVDAQAVSNIIDGPRESDDDSCTIDTGDTEPCESCPKQDCELHPSHADRRTVEREK